MLKQYPDELEFFLDDEGNVWDVYYRFVGATMRKPMRLQSAITTKETSPKTKSKYIKKLKKQKIKKKQKKPHTLFFIPY